MDNKTLKSLLQEGVSLLMDPLVAFAAELDVLSTLFAGSARKSQTGNFNKSVESASADALDMGDTNGSGNFLDDLIVRTAVTSGMGTNTGLAGSLLERAEKWHETEQKLVTNEQKARYWKSQANDYYSTMGSAKKARQEGKITKEEYVKIIRGIMYGSKKKKKNKSLFPSSHSKIDAISFKISSLDQKIRNEVTIREDLASEGYTAFGKSWETRYQAYENREALKNAKLKHSRRDNIKDGLQPSYMNQWEKDLFDDGVDLNATRVSELLQHSPNLYPETKKLEMLIEEKDYLSTMLNEASKLATPGTAASGKLAGKIAKSGGKIAKVGKFAGKAAGTVYGLIVAAQVAKAYIDYTFYHSYASGEIVSPKAKEAALAHGAFNPMLFPEERELGKEYGMIEQRKHDNLSGVVRTAGNLGGMSFGLNEKGAKSIENIVDIKSQHLLQYKRMLVNSRKKSYEKISGEVSEWVKAGAIDTDLAMRMLEPMFERAMDYELKGEMSEKWFKAGMLIEDTEEFLRGNDLTESEREKIKKQLDLDKKWYREISEMGNFRSGNDYEDEE